MHGSRSALVVGTLCWIAIVALLSPAAPAAERPNVLFIVSDDLNTLLGCYGDSFWRWASSVTTRPSSPPEAPYFGLYPEASMPVVSDVKADQADLPAAALGSAKREQDAMTDDLRRQAVQAYYASISFMDAQVGRVIAALDRNGLADDTIIVFTSDHGYHLGEHGLWQKQSLFEESVRVPLMIVAPGVAAPGSVARAPVSQVDLYPTLAALCRVDAPANLQGQSLVPLLADPAATGRGWALAQVGRPGFQGYSLRTPRWRYTEWDEGRQGRELYDHESDPKELVNLAERADHAATVAELSGQLQAAVATTLPTSGERPKIRPGVWNPTVVRSLLQAAELENARGRNPGSARLVPASLPADNAEIQRTPLVIREGGTADKPVVFDGKGLVVDLGTDVTGESWERDGDVWTLPALAGRTLPIMAGQSAALFVDEIPIVVPRDLDAEAREPSRRSWCYLPPHRLAPGQAGFTDAGGLVFRWPEGKTPATSRLILPPAAGTSAVTIACSHVIIRNLTARYAANDGFNIHGGHVGIVLEDVRAICNGDEGISAHGDIELRVRRAEVAGNGSAAGGVADVGRSVTSYEDCVLHDNAGAAFHFSGERHTVSRCQIYNQTKSVVTAEGTHVTTTDLVWER